MTAAAISPTTGRAYGVARVCQAFNLPRSSFYAARQQKTDPAAPTDPGTPAWAEAHAVGCGAAGSDPHRPRPFALARRGTS